MNVNEKYERWLKSPVVSVEMKDLLRQMNKEEKDDAFFKDVEFGTAGMRGILGPGTNRLNTFTVRKATVGFALYLQEKFPRAHKQGVVISHDNRHQSREFTLLCAKVLNDFGINTFIFDSLRPTPELSFAVRYLHCCGGIMITASHNPKEYNGYKVYDETGCQLVPEKIDRLIYFISSLPSEIDLAYDPVAVRGVNKVLNHDVDDAYVRLVEGISIHPELPKDGFKIVFTPNHGTSYVNAMRIFFDLGYNVYPVMKQCDPDPDFSQTLSPNPEDPRAYIEPIKLAKEINADLVVMTDPDGDRVGLAYRAGDGTYRTFTGNQSGAMLIDYIFTEKKKINLLSANPAVYTTIVTSSLGKEIALSHGAHVEEFLTGFKYIGHRIEQDEKNNGPHFEFGYEESYGCLIAPFARDKDGCQAILLYCEMALFYHLQGKTLDVVWKELNEKYGWHVDKVYSMAFSGSSGQQKMNDLMDLLHDSPFITVAGSKVYKVEDYWKQMSLVGEKRSPITLPKSNVVKLYFENKSTVCIRPSGTEPKIKFYIGVVGDDEKTSESMPDIIYADLKRVLKL